MLENGEWQETNAQHCLVFRDDTLGVAEPTPQLTEETETQSNKALKKQKGNSWKLEIFR